MGEHRPLLSSSKLPAFASQLSQAASRCVPSCRHQRPPNPPCRRCGPTSGAQCRVTKGRSLSQSSTQTASHELEAMDGRGESKTGRMLYLAARAISASASHGILELAAVQTFNMKSATGNARLLHILRPLSFITALVSKRENIHSASPCRQSVEMLDRTYHHPT